MLLTITRIIMGLLYIAAGANHFINPKFYLRIIPPILPFHEAINVVSGAAEIVLGILLLIPATSQLAAWGIVLLLIAVFPANVYHLTSGGAGMNVPIWALWVRLPLQGVLIWWAYLYT